MKMVFLLIISVFVIYCIGVVDIFKKNYDINYYYDERNYTFVCGIKNNQYVLEKLEYKDDIIIETFNYMTKGRNSFSKDIISSLDYDLEILKYQTKNNNIDIYLSKNIDNKCALQIYYAFNIMGYDNVNLYYDENPIFYEKIDDRTKIIDDTINNITLYFYNNSIINPIIYYVGNDNCEEFIIKEILNYYNINLINYIINDENKITLDVDFYNIDAEKSINLCLNKINEKEVTFYLR